METGTTFIRNMYDEITRTRKHPHKPSNMSNWGTEYNETVPEEGKSNLPRDNPMNWEKLKVVHNTL